MDSAEHQNIVRGREPLVPERYSWDFRFLPDGLFCDDDAAFLRSLRGKHAHALMALERLFEMGGYVRDGMQDHATVTAEQYFGRFAFGITNAETCPGLWCQPRRYSSC